jgi:hypothetical protein
MQAITFGLIAKCLVMLFGAIPLYIAVRILGGEASFLKALLVKLAGAAVFFGVSLFYGPAAGLASGLLLLILYRAVFDLSTVKAIIAFVIEEIVVILAILGLIALGIGISLM